MTKIKFCLLATAFGLLSATLCAAQSGATKFRGSIDQSRFEMTLERSGDQLAGSYFYPKVGSSNPLKLRGKIEPNGKFTLRELDAAGKQTGEFTGTWKNDPNEAGAALEGEWRAPGAKEPKVFWASEQMIAFSDNRQFVTKKIADANKPKRLEIEAEYPELAGAAGFNQAMQSLAGREVADFRKAMLQVDAEELKRLRENGMSNSMTLGYDIKMANDDFVSVNFTNWSYTGGVHGNSYTITVNYDLKSNRQLKLAELFKPGAKYLDKIAAIVKADLQSRKDPDSGENLGLASDIFEDGAKPTADNYSRWNLTNKGLEFTFDPYQVAAYAFGPQTAIVPYEKLREIINPSGALTKMMK